MALVENLHTGQTFTTSHDMVRDYVDDPLYRVTFSTPQVVTDGRHAETITGWNPTPKETKLAIREAVRARREQMRSRTSPGFGPENQPRSITLARSLRRGA